VGCKGAVSEPGHVFKAIENFVACVRLDLSQHHMDGVGSNIDDGNLGHKLAAPHSTFTIGVVTTQELHDWDISTLAV